MVEPNFICFENGLFALQSDLGGLRRWQVEGSERFHCFPYFHLLSTNKKIRGGAEGLSYIHKFVLSMI